MQVFMPKAFNIFSHNVSKLMMHAMAKDLVPTEATHIHLAYYPISGCQSHFSDPTLELRIHCPFFEQAAVTSLSLLHWI